MFKMLLKVYIFLYFCSLLCFRRHLLFHLLAVSQKVSMIFFYANTLHNFGIVVMALVTSTKLCYDDLG